ncbi:30S ribosomal protein S13 [Candidatus Woesearchaeota archaeon]|nr:30S ribosomal protein S13 [Candidatus Woesearchaeota archaeon]
MPANFRHLVRIANTDLKGDKSVFIALRGIRGVSGMYSHMVCHLSGIHPAAKAGTLTDQQVTLIDNIIRHPIKHHAPSWMLNRRKNYETGEDGHIITNDLIFTKDNDLKRLKKIKSYRGIRHMAGLPVRGQRVKSKHRRNKASGKGKLGVIRKAVQPPATPKTEKK